MDRRPSVNMPNADLDNDRSQINLDITRKLQTYMDFSVVLNKRSDETMHFPDFELNKTGLGNVTSNNIWNVSCINKQV